MPQPNEYGAMQSIIKEIKENRIRKKLFASFIYLKYSHQSALLDHHKIIKINPYTFLNYSVTFATYHGVFEAIQSENILVEPRTGNAV